MCSHATPFRRAASWLFVEGGRLEVVAELLLAAFLVLLLVDPVQAVRDRDTIPTFYVFGGILSGNLGLLTIVLSINQLVFSRELSPPGQLERDIEAIADRRREVARAGGRAVAPVVPGEFLDLLLASLRDELATLADAVAHAEHGALRERTNELQRSLGRQLERIERRLDPDQPGTLVVLAAMLPLTLAEDTHRASRLRAEFGDDLPDDGLASLEPIVHRLQLLNVVRNHFKSLYTQEHLSNMSRLILFVGVPTLLVLAVFVLEFVGPLDATARSLISPPFLSLMVVVGFAPLAIGFASILRAATISYRTATTTQFTG